MSYDLYCYRSKLGRPDLEEAQSVIEENDEMKDIPLDLNTKYKIAEALIEYNPRLESFDFDYNEIAKFEGISIEEAKNQFDHIELNTPEGDLATQITIFDNFVSISIPYWYSGDEANMVFNKVNNYTKIINKTTGYFVYDPQSEIAYSPEIEDFDGLEIYKDMTQKVNDFKKEDLKSRNKKNSWWKFW